MFEAVVTLCLLAAPDTCRDALLPGYEAATNEECAKRLAARPPGVAALFEPFARPSPPGCREAGAGADFEEIAPGVFAHRGAISDAAPDNHGDVGNVAFVVGETSVAVIDAGGSRRVGEDIHRAIRTRTDLPISHVILTHMHPDHVLGATVFADAGAAVVGHEKLASALADRSATYLENIESRIGAAPFIGTRIVAPDIAVADRLAIDLGGRALEARAWPVAHTGADLTVWDAKTATLFAGDLVFDEHAPALDGSATGWAAVLAELRALPAKRVVPGHGGPSLEWPEGGAALARYLDVLIADTRAAIRRGDSLGEAVETIGLSEAENWRLFDLFNPRNATVAYTELEWE